MIPSISDAMRQVVSDTEAAIKADATVNFGTVPKQLFFRHGNMKEISQQLTELTASPVHKGKKFPLVVLFRDIDETLTESLNGITTGFNCRMAIFTLTESTYNSDQRETKTFKPVLRPILEAFLNQLSQSSVFGMPKIADMKVKKADCFFYGSALAGANPFNDFVDAIEVQNISLKLKNIC